MRKKIRFYKALLAEVIEALCSICLYLERDGHFSHNYASTHMRDHFTVLKKYSEELRR